MNYKTMREAINGGMVHTEPLEYNYRNYRLIIEEELRERRAEQAAKQGFGLFGNLRNGV